MSSVPTTSGPPRVIYLIRHGEKPPASGAPFGVDVDGEKSGSSLIPQGWQRAGGLASLFYGSTGEGRADLSRPDHLYAPSYGTSSSMINHRTYETILPLSARLGVQIDTTFAEGDESSLAQSIQGSDSGVSLVCWEHDHIPAIAANIKATPNVDVPTSWPQGRFDVIWCFTQSPAQPGSYTFSALPESLLAGDGGP